MGVGKHGQALPERGLSQGKPGPAQETGQWNTAHRGMQKKEEPADVILFEDVPVS